MCCEKALLTGLEGEGITLNIRNLAKYMAGAGVLVAPHIARRRGYIPLSEKTWGFDIGKLNEEGKAFFAAQVKSGHLNFIPKEDEKSLNTLDQALRRAVQSRTLADGFVPVTAYPGLKEEFQKIREAYLEKRDDICGRWPLIVANFKAGVVSMLDGVDMDADTKAQFVDQFMQAVPKLESYKNSFSMGLKVQAFPDSVALDGLEESVQADVLDSWKRDVVDTAISAIIQTIQGIWDRCLTAMSQYLKSGTINSKTVDAIGRDAEALTWKNVFANPHLTELAALLGTIRDKEADKQAELIEVAVVKTFTYARLARFELSMEECPYTVDQLESLERMVA